MSTEKEELLKSVQGLITDSEKSTDERIKGLATSEDVLSLGEKLKGSPTNEDIEDIKKAFTNLEATIGAMKEKEVVKMEDPILKAFIDNKDIFSKAIKSRGASEEIEFKATVGAIDTFTSANYLPESPNLVPSAYNRNPRFANENVFNVLNHATVTNASAPTFTWYVINNEEGDAEWLNECELKPLSDFDIEEDSSKAKKVAIGFKICDEQLQDLPFMKSKIDEYMNKLITKALTQGVINGDGVSENLKGWINYANVFAGTDFAETVQDPTNWDVASTLKNYLACLDCNATDMIINCADWSAMVHEKDGEGRYNLPPMAKEQSIAGINFIPVASNVMPKGSFLLYDRSEAKIAVWDALSMRVGYDDGDFRRNRQLFLLEGRFLSYVENDCGFVKGTFQDVKDIIAEVPVVTP